jgi:dimethylamine/trimethylamine dehydrogenase
VVIFDDEEYHIAAAIAGMLAGEGLDVTYVTPGKVAAEWAIFTTEQPRLQAGLIERGVRIVTSATVTALLPGEAELACGFTGRRSRIACAGFVPVTSREPRDGLWRALQDAGLSTLERVGDARAPGLIAHAVHDGHRAGRAHLAVPQDLAVRREHVVIAAP